MRHFTISSVPMLMFVTTLTTGSVVTAQSACSTQTLSGDYGAKIEGTRLTNNDTVRTLALFRFDGHGGLTAWAYPVVNGTPPPNNEWVQSTGTYTVDSTCTGSLELVFPPIRFRLVVVNGGRQVYLITDGDALSGEARKVD